MRKNPFTKNGFFHSRRYFAFVFVYDFVPIRTGLFHVFSNLKKFFLFPWKERRHFGLSDEGLYV